MVLLPLANYLRLSLHFSLYIINDYVSCILVYTRAWIFCAYITDSMYYLKLIAVLPGNYNRSSKRIALHSITVSVEPATVVNCWLYNFMYCMYLFFVVLFFLGFGSDFRCRIFVFPNELVFLVCVAVLMITCLMTAVCVSLFLVF